MLAYPDAQILDVTGPLEVFAIATRILGARNSRDPGYRIELVAASAGPVRMSSGLELVAPRAARDLRGPVDTLFVAGGEGVRGAAGDADVGPRGLNPDVADPQVGDLGRAEAATAREADEG